jgi:hypothetical protein
MFKSFGKAPHLLLECVDRTPEEFEEVTRRRDAVRQGNAGLSDPVASLEL